MSEPLVTIAQFRETTDVAVAKGAMDHAGIDSAVADVRLEVHNEDAYRAYDVLDSSCPSLSMIEEAYEGSRDLTLCAVCDSSNIAPAPRLAAFGGMATLAVGIGAAIGHMEAAFFAVGAAGLFFLISDRWRCSECGASWN